MVRADVEGRADERSASQALLGSGAAVAVGFSVPLRLPGVLLLGSDGLWKYARPEAIADRLSLSVAEAAPALVELVRYPSGSLPDDLAVAICCPRAGARL